MVVQYIGWPIVQLIGKFLYFYMNSSTKIILKPERALMVVFRAFRNIYLWKSCEVCLENHIYGTNDSQTIRDINDMYKLSHTVTVLLPRNLQAAFLPRSRRLSLPSSASRSARSMLTTWSASCTCPTWRSPSSSRSPLTSSSTCRRARTQPSWLPARNWSTPRAQKFQIIKASSELL